MNSTQTVLVMLGLDKDQKTRAATFAIEDTETAVKVASTMGLRLARAETPEAIAIAKQLPKGKLYGSGKGLLPLVRREVYDKLAKLILPANAQAASPASKPAAQPAETASAAGKPFLSPWDAIEIGATVLWHASKDEGWFEAIVVKISKDRKVLTMRWRDYPKLPQFNVKRFDVGIICKIT
jgi:hypothetical protein